MAQHCIEETSHKTSATGHKLLHNQNAVYASFTNDLASSAPFKELV